MELLDLARHLKQEQLFVSSERSQLQKLFDDVKKIAEELYHVSWVTREQKNVLDTLIVSPQNISPKECCGKINHLQYTHFVDSYKYLTYNDSRYGEFFKFLRENPALLAHCIEAGERSHNDSTLTIIKLLINSIFGNCLLPEDEHGALHLMKTLAELQLGSSDDPRRLLRKSSCSFSAFSKQVFDSLFSAKLFLTSALHEPAMRLLMEDEWFFDIDPKKAFVRFPPAETLKRFGEPGTEAHAKKCQEYRTFIVNKLVILSNRFINSLRNNIHCFPVGLAWLVSQVHRILTKSGKISPEKVQAVCADLVFALFICPAICDPEPHGILSDINISHIARHNLMQIAQIIQYLSLAQWEEDCRAKDLYQKFEKGCVSGLLDAIIQGMGPELPLTVPNFGLPTHTHALSRTSVLITLPHLNLMVSYLNSVLPQIGDQVREKKQLEELLQNLPSPSSLQPPNASPHVSAVYTPPDTPSNQRKLFKGTKKKLSMTPNLPQNQMSDENSPLPSETDQAPVNEEVLVISLGTDIECPGMMPEQKVLTWEQENKRRRVKYQSTEAVYVGEGGAEIQEKRTRFSLSQDQESIGNTSDIQEAISEAASSHSVGSVDMEEDNDPDDNLSDMISANVSGRGTPNLSGRDTPLSQVESEPEPEPPAQLAPQLPENVQKPNRVDVTDRFGKFEIEREEMRSTVSDTWSTDVLASDSEPPEQNQFERLEEIREEMVRQSLLAREVVEVSETASDAWSTDVLGSDTDEKHAEILSEFDQDDVGSVTDLASLSGDPSALDSIANEEPSLPPEDSNNLENLGAVGGLPAPLIPIASPPSNLMRQRTNNKGNSSSKSSSISDSVFDETEDSQGSSSHAQFAQVRPMSAGVDNNRLGIPQKSHKSHAKPSHNSGKHSNYLMVPELTRVSVNSQGPEKTAVSNGTRPKTSPASMHKNTFGGTGVLCSQGPATDLFSLDDRESSIPITRKSGNVSWTPASVNGGDGMDLLTSQAENLKITEQQNTNLDANRLSAALSMFDPVTSESNTGELLDETSTTRAKETYAHILATPATSSYKKKDSQDLGKGSTGKKGVASSSDLELACLMPDAKSKHDDLLGASAKTDAATGSKRNSDASSHSSDSEEDGPFAKSSRSCSYDNISQRGSEKDMQEEDTHDRKKGFFKSFKDKINKGMKRKTQKPDRDEADNNSLHKMAFGSGKDETTEDILAKYRPKPQGILTVSSAGESNVNSLDGAVAAGGSRVLEAASGLQGASRPEKRFSMKEEEGEQPHYDPNNLESCFAFVDAKRKLRLVLSSAECQVGYSLISMGFSSAQPGQDNDGKKEVNELERFLRDQLAEAINLQNKGLIAQLHEAKRCVQIFDENGRKKLIGALQDEYQSRSAYISYLIRCRQGLLSIQSHLNHLLLRVNRYKDVCSRHLTTVFVRLFIEKREADMIKFCQDFQKLTVPDEKTDLVEHFLNFLYQSMNQDPIWQAADQNQVEDARLGLERVIMSRIYGNAVFPNGDGDIDRDRVFHQHLRKLGQNLTPSHKDLRIPKMYTFECPWSAAQREIFLINAYKTPKDKLECVQRCSTTIMNLLSMANEKSVPAADDFMPVMIFVLIKANPPCLLSTIQYVNSFYGNRMQGEEQYWWMQFSSAVEFIKTMEYS